MHITIIVLTALVIILIAWQWLGKKGTAWHVSRGFFLLFSAALLVALVVGLTFYQGVVWTPLLAIHIAIGVGFFFALFRTIASGFRAAFAPWNLEKIKMHRQWTRITTMLLVLTLISAFVATTYRRDKEVPEDIPAVTM